MTIDYAKSPEEIVVQLINDENQQNLTVDDLDLTNLSVAPDPVPGREVFNNVRTALRVSAAAGSGFTNQVDIKYNRVHLRQVFPNTESSNVRYPNSMEGYNLGSNATLVDLLSDINARHGINIAPGDVFDLPLPTFNGPPPYADQYVRLEVKADHLVYIGGINLKVYPNAWDLQNLQLSELNGLVYPVDDSQEIPASWTGLRNLITTMSQPNYFG